MTDKNVSYSSYHESVEDALDWFDSIQDEDEAASDLFIVHFELHAFRGTKGAYYATARYSSTDPLQPQVGDILQGADEVFR